MAQIAPGDSFQLRTRSSSPGSGLNIDSGAVPWVVALVCLFLFGIMLATLWPNDSESNPYQRQRKFARIDGLFFKIKGKVLTEDDSKSFLKSLKANGRPEVASPQTYDQLTLLSLSFGGCSILGNQGLAKGNVVLLELNTLPDFPAKQLVIAAKIVWTRSEVEHGKRFEVAGAKFVYASDRDSSESLRQYLNYLMDEPVT